MPRRIPSRDAARNPWSTGTAASRAARTAGAAAAVAVLAGCGTAADNPGAHNAGANNAAADYPTANNSAGRAAGTVPGDVAGSPAAPRSGTPGSAGRSNDSKVSPRSGPDSAGSENRHSDNRRAGHNSTGHDRTGYDSARGFSTGDTSGSGTATATDPAVLQDVRLVREAGVDAIRIEFAPGSGTPDYDIGYQPRPLRYEGSGRPANLPGGPALAVDLAHADGTGIRTGSVLVDPARQSIVEQVKGLGSFEGHAKLGAALIDPVERLPFRVSTGQHSITIELRTSTG